VYAYVAYRIGPGPDAEDATSEVFARALRYRSTFDAAKGTPAAWLTGIARRVLAERATERFAPVGEVPDTPPAGQAIGTAAFATYLVIVIRALRSELRP
jgi:DNA-directed RNA polymerase specialized sigma24 family protein